MRILHSAETVALAILVVSCAMDAAEPNSLLFPTNAPRRTDLIDVRRQTSTREGGLLSSNLNRLGLSYDIPGRRMQVETQPQALPTRILSSLEQAERINADAMDRYRENWMLFLKSPRAMPKPTLYPTRIQQVLESAR
jgi:hypothetical protein